YSRKGDKCNREYITRKIKKKPLKNYIDSLWTGETQIMHKSEGYIGKKSKTLCPEEIRTFIDEAPDQFLYLFYLFY
ncbi:hypothetical protein NQ318_012017, partial [Aromia moschata]